MIYLGDNLNYNPCEPKTLSLNEIIDNITNEITNEKMFIGYNDEAEELEMSNIAVNFEFDKFDNQIKPVLN